MAYSQPHLGYWGKETVMSIIRRHIRERILEERRVRLAARDKRADEAFRAAQQDVNREIAKMRLTRQMELEDSHGRGERLDEAGMDSAELARTVDRWNRNR